MTFSPAGRIFPWTCVAVLAAGVAFCARGSKPGSSAAPARDPWAPEQLMTPDELAKRLTDSKAEKPLVAYVGFKFLYDGAHIPGALYAGPGRESKGLEALRKWASGIPRDKTVVLYCGCCPWDECPNIRPAFRVLSDLGFTRIKVLRINDNFAHDWVAKGYPTQKGGT